MRQLFLYPEVCAHLSRAEALGMVLEQGNDAPAYLATVTATTFPYRYGRGFRWLARRLKEPVVAVLLMPHLCFQPRNAVLIVAFPCVIPLDIGPQALDLVL
jgi:hypothetical protein